MTLLIVIFLAAGCGTPAVKEPKEPVRSIRVYSSNAGIKTSDGVFTHLMRAYKDLHKSERGGFEKAVLEYHSHLKSIFLIKDFSATRSSGPYLNIEQRGIDSATNAINEIQQMMEPSPSPSSAKIMVLQAGCEKFLKFISYATVT